MAGIRTILNEKDNEMMTPSEASEDFDLAEHRQAFATRAYQQGTQFVSIDVLLKKLDLLHYLDDFLQADADMIENYASRSDEEVEGILRNVERVNRFTFAYADRIRLWKSLRYRWFSSPEFAKSFVHSSEIPELILPKKDFRIRDSNIDLKHLDSERLRMVTRRAVYDETEGTTVIQEEIYQRQTPLFYELTGLERTLQFWLNQDPRKMSREDPREEVFLTQMKSMELLVATLIDQLKLKRRIKRLVIRVFSVVQIIFLVISIFFFIVAIINATSSVSTKPASEVFYSSSQLRCAALYVSTFFFITEVIKQRQNVSHYDKAKKMHAKCRFMYNDMISFRLKTHHLRQQTLHRYVDDAKVVEEPVHKSAVHAASSSFRKHTMVTADSAYDEYIGTGVLSAEALDTIKQTENMNDLPPERQSANRPEPSVLPQQFDDLINTAFPNGEPVLNVVENESRSAEDFDEDDWKL